MKNDERMIQDAYKRLIDTYLASPHRKKVDIIEKAFNFAKQAHQGVRRLSGEPYIMHPLAVAQIVCEEIGLGSTSICSALLHDVVEDTDYTVEDIRNIFGPKIAQIVDGVTKISGGIFGNQASAQAETFKKLLLTMSDDIRVILIKISDRLHNMRTLGSQLPAKQYKITGETLYIYAPLANRLGLNRIKEELEDLSFRYEHPEQYASIRERLSAVSGHLQEVFDDFTAPIRQSLDKIGLKYEIKARIKSPYSIWRKMQNKGVTLEEVYDILAARIIFEGNGVNEDEIDECWRIYSSTTQIYRSHPERLRDWLAHPKPNGYQALQTTLMSRSGMWIELQIRSRRMDDIAEHGFAAHWKYKDGDKSKQDSETQLDHWLATIKEILDDPQPNAMDFLDVIKLNLYASEIFVVTPKGEFKTMPSGCTVLDFAFSVHSTLGTRCMGAKVNHKLVPLSHKLESGDQVEVLTGRNVQVTQEWLQYATTAKARSKIQAILRRQRRQKHKEGEEMLLAFLREHQLPTDSGVIDRLCTIYKVQAREQLFYNIASRAIVLGEDDVRQLNNRRSKGKWRRFIPFLKAGKQEEPVAMPKQGDSSPKPHQSFFSDYAPMTLPVLDQKKPLLINEDTISRYLICEHCHPIPGDEILAYQDAKGYVTIHKRQCGAVERVKAIDGNGILAATWDTHKVLYFHAVIHVDGIDRVGVLHQMTGILSQQMNVNISSINIQTTQGIFSADIGMEVHDLQDLNDIIKDLKKIKEIKKVVRTN